MLIHELWVYSLVVGGETSWQGTPLQVAIDSLQDSLDILVHLGRRLDNVYIIINN